MAASTPVAPTLVASTLVAPTLVAPTLVASKVAALEDARLGGAELEIIAASKFAARELVKLGSDAVGNSADRWVTWIKRRREREWRERIDLLRSF